MQTATGALVGPTTRGRRPSVPTKTSGRVARRRQDGRAPYFQGPDRDQLKTTIGPDTGLPCFKGGQTLPLVHHKEEEVTWQS